MARVGGVVTVLTGLPFDWFNQVLVEREEATTADVLAGVTLARGRDHPSSFACATALTIASSRRCPTRDWRPRWKPRPSRQAWSLRPSTADAITAVALAHDSTSDGSSDAAGIEVHRRTMTDGFGSDPAIARSTVCEDLLDRPGARSTWATRPVNRWCTGLGWRTGRTAGVYSIATIPSARRRRVRSGDDSARRSPTVWSPVVTSLCSRRATWDGRSTSGLGFRTVVRYIAYVHPAQPPVAVDDDPARP